VTERLDPELLDQLARVYMRVALANWLREVQAETAQAHQDAAPERAQAAGGGGRG